MSKKQLDTAGILNELKGGSVFFQKAVEPQPSAGDVREERDVRSVRPVRSAVKRERKRHPFDIYRDQLETLVDLKSRYMMETGEMKSMSEMVREALDKYFETKQNCP
jgi:hypothetical protein